MSVVTFSGWRCSTAQAWWTSGSPCHLAVLGVGWSISCDFFMLPWGVAPPTCCRGAFAWASSLLLLARALGESGHHFFFFFSPDPKAIGGLWKKCACT